MQVLPVASGKGGVGKSLVAANLSIALAQAGMSVILADLDLGGSNLHTILGMRAPRRGIGTFVTDGGTELSSYIVPTQYDNLKFIPGDTEIPGLANLATFQKKRLMKKLRGLDADVLLLDLGSGTSFNTLDFFLMSGRGIVVTTPNLTAILNGYLFLKNAVFRLIETSFPRKSPAAAHLKSIKSNSELLQRIYIPRLLEELRGLDEKGYDAYTGRKNRFHPMLVLNLLDDPKDSGRVSKIRRTCIEYLDLDVEHLGVVYRDSLQEVALSSGLPIMVYKPQSVLSQAILRVAEKVCQYRDEEIEEAEDESFDESYEVADAEAEADFNTKMLYVQDLIGGGALTQSDLVETIRMQQYELSGLRKENRLLKAKLVEAINAGFPR